MTFAVCQSSGVVEVERDLLKMIVNMGTISFEKSFSVRDRISSGPAALWGFRSQRSFSTPCTVIVMFCISG